MSTGASHTEVVRQELARAPADGPAAEVELAALLRSGGSLTRRGDGLVLELSTSTGAVVRRAHRLLGLLGAHPTIWVREPTNIAGRQYGAELDAGTAPSVGRRLGLLDAHGRPTEAPSGRHAEHPAALVRGALLGAGSVSTPGRAPHLELGARTREWAGMIAGCIDELVGHRAGVSPTDAGHRVTVKSGAAIAALLELLGATQAAAAHRDTRQRRQLRADAQRLANADAANVRRAVDAAGSQVDLVERAIDVLGWDGLPEELRDVALARLANPAASLADLGQLCDPPVGKSAVHRRLGRLRVLVEEAGTDPRA